MTRLLGARPSSRQRQQQILRWCAHVTFVALALVVLWPVVRWLSIDAVFWPPTPEACQVVSPGSEDPEPIAGACWPVVIDTLQLLLFGRYPQAELWRLGLAALCAGAAFATALQGRKVLQSLALLVLAWLLVLGAPWLGLSHVPPSDWGGLALTLILSAAGLTGGFSLGLMLALARVSNMPIARWMATGYIETLRGVPLITVLFFALYLVPLVLPAGSSGLSEVARAAIAIILFQAAYIAEVIRAGLAAVDPGQDEAARALGMGPWQRQRLIVLPQALRYATPALVSTSIGLVKDTSLVAIIGLFDLLGTARNVPSIPRWIGRDLEPLIFAGMVYLILSLLLEKVARRYDQRLSALALRN